MLVSLRSGRNSRPARASERGLGVANQILLQTGRQHFWQGRGALSIKSFTRGRALYDAGTGRHAVDDRSYLILNEGQDYSITVDAATPLTSFCLFFEDGFAEGVQRSLSTSATGLLDDPEGGRQPPLRFFQRTYPHDDVLSPALFALRDSLPLRQEESGWLEERLHGIVQRLLAVHARARVETVALPALRPATREELARRLYRARDFLDASIDESVSLADIARAACLSANHLLRTFRALFGVTPHAYLTAARLERARVLLASDTTVTDVALSVGFESPSAFGRLFRKRMGVSPAAYRTRKR